MHCLVSVMRKTASYLVCYLSWNWIRSSWQQHKSKLEPSFLQENVYFLCILYFTFYCAFCNLYFAFVFCIFYFVFCIFHLVFSYLVFSYFHTWYFVFCILHFVLIIKIETIIIIIIIEYSAQCQLSVCGSGLDLHRVRRGSCQMLLSTHTSGRYWWPWWWWWWRWWW